MIFNSMVKYLDRPQNSAFAVHLLLKHFDANRRTNSKLFSDHRKIIYVWLRRQKYVSNTFCILIFDFIVRSFDGPQNPRLPFKLILMHFDAVWRTISILCQMYAIFSFHRKKFCSLIKILPLHNLKNDKKHIVVLF